MFSVDRCFGKQGFITSSITYSSNIFCSTSGACWVDNTTVSIATGAPSSYLIVTCDFASGLNQSTLLFFLNTLALRQVGELCL